MKTNGKGVPSLFTLVYPLIAAAITQDENAGLSKNASSRGRSDQGFTV
jgi:hypothetical protein